MSTVTINSLRYQLFSGYCEIIGYDNNTAPNSWNLVIPETITHNSITYPVTTIRSYSLITPKITSLDISSPVLTSIKEGAFQGTSITSIIIPNNNITYENYVFSGCQNLNNITYKKFITSNIFHGLNNPNSTWTLDYNGSTPAGLLNSRTNIVSVILKEGITEITYYFMVNNPLVTSLIIPSTVTNIQNESIRECFNLNDVTFSGIIPTIGTQNFQSGSDTVKYNQTINIGNPRVAPMLAMFSSSSFIADTLYPNITYPLCFPAGTPVLTDQGSIAIEKINPSIHTIRGKNIVAVTKTVTIEDKIVCIEKDALCPNIPSQKTYISRNHELLYNKQMIKAKNLIGVVDGVYNKKYNGEILYNVLLDKHDKMVVNNLIVETLDPENIVAKLYNGDFTAEEKNNIIVNLNNGAKEYKKQFGKMR